MKSQHRSKLIRRGVSDSRNSGDIEGVVVVDNDYDNDDADD